MKFRNAPYGMQRPSLVDTACQGYGMPSSLRRTIIASNSSKSGRSIPISKSKLAFAGSRAVMPMDPVTRNANSSVIAVRNAICSLGLSKEVGPP